MRNRPDRLGKLLTKKVKRPFKESEYTPPESVPTPERTAEFIEEVRERDLHKRISAKPLMSRRARLRRLGMTLADIYKTD